MENPITLQVGVKALLKNSNGKYLLLRRNPDKYKDVGTELWDIVGGRIEPGRPLLDNLQREIREETGLELTSAPKLVAAQDILKVPGRHVVRLTYVGEIEGEPVLDNDHTEFGWFTIEEIKNLDNLDSFLNEALTHIELE
jgi:ADP-ribose pyrophosphatase YjhB (NUDIX family)